MDLATVRPRVGSLGQVARIEHLRADGGRSGSGRIVRIVNGGGLEFEVLPDRALDLGTVTFEGLPLAWRSSVGAASPYAYEPEGRGWLRTFGGGLLNTCGLDTFGAPSVDEGMDLPMHGRVGSIPADVTRTEVTDDAIVLEGEVRQSGVFDENLVLRRRVSSAIGTSGLRIEDTVTNDAFIASPHMILYHINLGWPLLDDDTIVDIGHETVQPRDLDAAAGLDVRHEIGAPVPGFREQVFTHTTAHSAQRLVSITSPGRGVTLTIRYSDTLPAVFQWKMVAPGYYALGIEPANTAEMLGRATAREKGALPYLEPGESRSYWVELNVTRHD